jgi:putative flippase GtrA
VSSYYGAFLISLPKPVALIPAYKPPPALREVVADLRARQLFECICVVDDGNGAAYAELFDQLRADGVEVLHHHVNLGKGMALRTGLNHLAVHYPGAAGVVTLDADGQHLPGDVAQVVECLRKHPQDLVLGVRQLPATAPWRSRFGNRLTRHVLRIFTGMSLSDTQTGLRGIPMGLIADLLRLKSVGYDFELDMLILANRHRIPIQEVSIATVYLDDNASSHFNPLLDSMKIYFVFLRFSSVSLMTAGIDYIIFALSFLFTGKVLVSMLLARLVAASFQFVMSYAFVFKDRQDKLPAIAKYGLVLCALTMLALGGIHAFDYFLGVSPLISKVIVEGLIYILSFLLLRDFVFSSADKD